MATMPAAEAAGEVAQDMSRDQHYLQLKAELEQQLFYIKSLRTCRGHAMAALIYPHIEVSHIGVPYIAGTQTKVIEIVLDRLAYHWDADEIHRQHPHLSLAQIHTALAYYYDHQTEMDGEIEAQLRRVAALKASLDPSPVRLKLQAVGRLP